MSPLPLARAHQLCATLIPPCISPPPCLRSATLPPLSAIQASELCPRRTPRAPLRASGRRRANAPRAQAADGPDGGKAATGGEGGARSGGGVKRVVVLGGSGRVGRSTAVALAALAASDDEATRAGFTMELVVSGRNRERGEAVCEEVRAAAGAAGSAAFAACDVTDAAALDSLLSGADLVVHCAGPFQRAPHCTVLEAAIRTKTPYIDVCDDVAYALTARSLHDAAVAAAVPAITTTGIYPGLSNLMAAELVRLGADERVRMEGEGDQQQAAHGLQPKSLRFSYFTAGTGGAGPTILATSLHLLGEPATAFKDGQRLQLPAYSRQRLVDFGPGVGERSTYLLNLPEVVSAHEVLGVPTVSARFGTAPHMWNWGMQLLRALLPQSVLQDRAAVQRVAGLLEPMVRAADGAAGERVAIRVDLETESGRSTTALFSHRRLSVSVGVATAAFAVAVLEGSAMPGVHYPEQTEAIPLSQRERLLQRATLGARFFAINKPGWMIEREPKQIGMGMYV
ncbi:hypothetical protein CLOM_g2117 [Closterium sp. NIES-68]|nr:hypothetical protein CLOM_g2117 [Closterium sp. NIES-68]GJP62768.1 hypothetical protein CLOP_g19795 [Closterium sp. NIES-67]GJP70838.1 hypothetical protein CLOP_g1733 [Closterium sp. NIES-67]